MANGDQIPAADEVSELRAEVDDLRELARGDARRTQQLLAWITVLSLAIAAIFAAALFALVIRNNVVILPDRAPRRADPAKTFLHFRGLDSAVSGASVKTPAGEFVDALARRERGHRG